MLKIYPAEKRVNRNHGWLNARFSFSFADYYDPDNTEFGPLRVFNDDIVQPATGFGMHGHREMEIVTVVLRGKLQHKDSMGNTEIIEPGQIQRMSAGTGIMHSEINPMTDEELNLLQLWFEPNVKGLQPSYEMISYDRETMKNKLLPIVSGRLPESPGTGKIHQDMTIYLSELEPGQQIIFEQDANRRIYICDIEGELTLNGEHQLKRRDAVRATDLPHCTIGSDTGATLMLIDLP